LDFIKKVSKTDLPLHPAFKAVPFLNISGNTVVPDEPNAWKFEKFIFDVIPHALKVRAILYPRDECFAPLKNAQGDASLEQVQGSLLARDRAVFKEITGQLPEELPLELSQDFYYPTESLKLKWKGKKAPRGYVEP
jgi:UDP-N-acetylglucosamine/UDP-N-acetylgalactosamine diphosphorylase